MAEPIDPAAFHRFLVDPRTAAQLERALADNAAVDAQFAAADEARRRREDLDAVAARGIHGWFGRTEPAA